MLANPDDQTNVSLIFANVTEDDILVAARLELTSSREASTCLPLIPCLSPT